MKVIDVVIRCPWGCGGEMILSSDEKHLWCDKCHKRHPVTPQDLRRFAEAAVKAHKEAAQDVEH